MTTELFTKFSAECVTLGYTNFMQHKNGVIMLWVKNGTKCEIKSNRYTIGWGRTSEELDAIKQEIQAQGFELSTKHTASDCINIPFNNDTAVVENFWKLVKIVESVDGLVARTKGIAKKVFPREVAEQNIFIKIAKTYEFAINNEHQFLLDQGRNLLEADSIDHLINGGESLNRTEDDTYREHVVPCIMIHNEVIRMTLAGVNNAEVAKMIADNLVIIKMSNSEQNTLDNVLKLRTTMPEGWNFGDDVFARLKAAGIELK